MKYTHVYVKVRRVLNRPFSSADPDHRHEASIIGRVKPGVWDTLGTVRHHRTAAAATIAALKLADRRGLTVIDDPRALRMIEYADRYGDLVTDTPTIDPASADPDTF